MDILKPLLKLLGMPVRQANNEAKVMDKESTPIDLSASQREQIESRIAEFIGDSSSVYAYTHAAITRLNALPLYFDLTAFIALRPDGQIIRIPYDDEPGEIEVI